MTPGPGPVGKVEGPETKVPDMPSSLPQQRVITTQTRLSLTSISKRFGGVQAIRMAEFHLLPGEVHALVGENGAGKSTLIKIISGAETADTGEITIDGKSADIRNASGAIDLGVATVYQEAQLFPQLTVAENIFLGRELTKGKRIDWVSQDKLAREALATVGLKDDCMHRKVEELLTGQQQQVSIAKALVGEAKVLILDEPSAILTDNEISNLFTAIRNLTAKGVAVIYISHRLDELAKVADVVTIMRDGITLGTFPVKNLTIAQIAETMVGGQLEQLVTERSFVRDDIVLAASGLQSARFHDVDLAIHAGETVVLYGLVGSGMAEIAAALYGKQPITRGSLQLKGAPYNPTSPKVAKRRGVSMLPANRKTEAMFSFQSIAFNISVGALTLIKKLGILFDRKKEHIVADELIEKLFIKTPDQAHTISTLSGGNAQKVILARQLVTRPDVLILAEPTQGVDIGAKEEIHRIIAGLCQEGTAVLIATSDLGEALRVADRLIVVRNGTCFAEFGPDATQSQVLAAASGELTESDRLELGEAQ